MEILAVLSYALDSTLAEIRKHSVRTARQDVLVKNDEARDWILSGTIGSIRVVSEMVIQSARHRFLHNPFNNSLRIPSATLSSSLKHGHQDSHVESTTRIKIDALAGETRSSFVQNLVTASRYWISCANRLRIIVAVSVLFSTGTAAVASLHSQDRVPYRNQYDISFNG